MLSESGSFAVKPPTSGRELVVNLTAVESVIARTPLVALGRYRCPVSHPQFAGGGPQACHYVVFPRRVVRICLAGARPEVATPGTLRFYNEGDQYERTAIDGQADESDWIALAPGILESLAADAGRQALASGVFREHSAPGSARLFLTQQRLFASVDMTLPGQRLGLEEAAIELVRDAMVGATAHWASLPRNSRRTTNISATRRRRIAEDAKEILARDPAHDLSLEQIASQVHCSVAHLARVFKRYTGVSLHQWRQQIRLHQALRRIDEGDVSLAQIAADLGFASHSHLTSTIFRYVGALPSAIRASALLEMSTRR